MNETNAQEIRNFLAAASTPTFHQWGKGHLETATELYDQPWDNWTNKWADRSFSYQTDRYADHWA